MPSKLTSDNLNISQYLNVPAITTEQRDAIQPAELGMFVFNISSNRFEVYDGSVWKRA